MTDGTTLGDVSARLVRLMFKLGATNDNLFSGIAVAELQASAGIRMPAAIDEMLGTLEMLAEASSHDRESLSRELRRCFNACGQWESTSTRLMDLCQRQGQIIDGMSE